MPFFGGSEPPKLTSIYLSIIFVRQVLDGDLLSTLTALEAEMGQLIADSDKEIMVCQKDSTTQNRGIVIVGPWANDYTERVAMFFVGTKEFC